MNIPDSCPKKYDSLYEVCTECFAFTNTECSYKNLPIKHSLGMWFDELIDDCKVIIVEHEYRSRLEIIEGYHELGKRILEENDNFDRAKIYGEKIVEHLANSLSISERTIRRAIKLVKEYPTQQAVLDAFKKEGKVISWSKIVKQLEGSEQKEKDCKHKWELFKICSKCHKKEKE